MAGRCPFLPHGVTAVTETEHFLGTVLAIPEITHAGGVFGREIEVVAYDPESDPVTYRRLAEISGRTNVAGQECPQKLIARSMIR
jgi:hypothetical protein